MNTTDLIDLDELYEGIEEPCDVQGNVHVLYILQVYVHSIICIVGFIGNTLVIVTYAFYKRTKSMTDVYLLNVAVADVLFVVALPLIIFSEQYNWSLGTWSCKMLRGIYSINLYSCMLLLACISVDRYLAIVQARRSFRLRSKTLIYSYVICALVWILALILSLPTFVFYRRYTQNDIQKSLIIDDYEQIAPQDTNMDFDYDKTVMEQFVSAAPKTVPEEQYICFFWFEKNETAQQMKILVPSSQVSVGFCLPLLIMGFCYSQVICTLLRARNFQRHKAVRVVLTVVLVFILCHLPYNAALVYDTITMFSPGDCNSEQNKNLVLILTESLAYLHCCLNPLLYAFIGVKFRNHFRKIVEDAWCRGKRYMGGRRTSRVTSEAYLSSRRSVESGTCENGTSFTM